MHMYEYIYTQYRVCVCVQKKKSNLIYLLEFKANIRCTRRAFRYSLGRISGLA